MTSDFSIAVHALVYLGKNQDLISSDELAKHICTHPVRVRRVMIKLREAGLIKAKAGVDGGYRLDKEADNITLSEIAKSVSNDYIHVTWHNGEDGRGGGRTPRWWGRRRARRRYPGPARGGSDGPASRPSPPACPRRSGPGERRDRSRRPCCRSSSSGTCPRRHG